MTAPALFEAELNLPLMLELAEQVRGDSTTPTRLGAMTKYKTFNGEEINGEKVWHYDFHNDDD